MASLANATPQNTYARLLQLNGDDNAGVTGSLTTILTGDGASTAAAVSTSGFRVTGNLFLTVVDAAPSAPASGAVLYVVSSGGKANLRCLFASGAAQTLATEP
jgi:hypothetical protein